MMPQIIFGILIVFLMAGTFFWMWKLSRWLVIPLQIVLFVLLIIVVFKVFATKENADKLREEVAKSKIPEIEEKILSTSREALQKPESDTGDTVEKSVPAAETDSTPAAPPPVKSEKKPANTSDINFVDLL